MFKEENVTYDDIINDFNQRGEVYEGTHSLVNFASKYYPNHFDAFYEILLKISDGADVKLFSNVPLNK